MSVNSVFNQSIGCDNSLSSGAKSAQRVHFRAQNEEEDSFSSSADSGKKKMKTKTKNRLIGWGLLIPGIALDLVLMSKKIKVPSSIKPVLDWVGPLLDVFGTMVLWENHKNRPMFK